MLSRPASCPCGSTNLHRIYLEAPERWVCRDCNTIVATVKHRAPLRLKCRQCGAPRNPEEMTKYEKTLGNLCKECVRRKRREKFRKWRQKPRGKILFRAAQRRSVQSTPERFIANLVGSARRRTTRSLKKRPGWPAPYQHTPPVRSKRALSKERTIIRSPESFIQCLVWRRRASLKYRAKKGIRMKDPKRREFKITADHLIKMFTKQKGLCAISGLPMTHQFDDPYAISIDRIDCKKGYVLKNVQLVCQWVNYAKSGFTDDQIRSVIAELRS